MTPRFFLWLILIAGLALRLVGLDGQSLWWDEAWQYYVVSGGDFGEFWGRLMNPRITLNPPLYHVLSYLSVSALAPVAGGLSDAVLRFPSVLLGVVNLPLVYALSRRVFPSDRSVALVALAVVAFAPFHVHYSQEARMYTLVMGLSLVSTLALLNAVERGGRWAWALYALAAAGAMYTHVHTLFGLLGHGVWLLVSHRTRLRAFILSGLGAALLFAPMVVFFLERVGNLKSPYGGAGASLFSVPYSVFVYSIGLSMGPSVTELKANRTLGALAADWPVVATVGVLFGALLVAGAFAARRAGRGAQSLLLSGLLVPIVGVSAAALIPDMTFNVRYTAWAFPFFVLLVGAGLVDAWRRRRALGVLAAGGVAALFLISNVERHRNPRYAKEDVRGAVAAWREVPGESILFSFNGSPTVERYLTPDEAAWHVPIYGRRAAQRRMTSVLEQVSGAGAAGADTVYVLLARDWGRIVESQVREGFRVVGDRDFPGGVSVLVVDVPVRIERAPVAGEGPSRSRH